MSTCRSVGETMRAEVTRATSSASGISKSCDQPRRDRAAAGLDATGAVEQQHRVAAARQIAGRGRAGRPAADDDRHRRSRARTSLSSSGRARRGKLRRCWQALGLAPASRRPTARPARRRSGTARPRRRRRSHRPTTGRAEEIAREVARERADKAAEAEGDRLRRAPQSHAHAFARVPGPRRQGPSSSRWRRPHRRRWRRRARTRTRAAAMPGRRGRQRPGSNSASAEAMQPPMVQVRSEPKRRPPTVALPASATSIMPSEHAAVLHAGQLRRFSRREAEDGAGERLEDQILRAVGEHRDEDEDREAARLRLGPHLGQALRNELSRASRASRPPAKALGCRPSMFQIGKQGEQEGRCRHGGSDGNQALRRKRIEQMARRRRGDDEASDHHHPDDRGRGGAALLTRRAWPAAPAARCRTRRRRCRSGRTKSTPSAMPASGNVAIQAVATAAPKPPSASTAMPPMIQGVRRPPTSEP